MPDRVHCRSGAQKLCFKTQVRKSNNNTSRKPRWVKVEMYQPHSNILTLEYIRIIMLCIQQITFHYWINLY